MEGDCGVTNETRDAPGRGQAEDANKRSLTLDTVSLPHLQLINLSPAQRLVHSASASALGSPCFNVKDHNLIDVELSPTISTANNSVADDSPRRASWAVRDGTGPPAAVQQRIHAARYAARLSDHHRNSQLLEHTRTVFDDRLDRPGNPYSVLSPDTGVTRSSRAVTAAALATGTATPHAVRGAAGSGKHSHVAITHKTSQVIYVLLISAIHSYLSILNAVQQDAWELDTFRSYVFAASSLTEVVGFGAGIACCLANDGDTQYLGQPLILIATGVIDDNIEQQIVGFRGITLQSGGNWLLLVYYACVAKGGYFWSIWVALGVLLLTGHFAQARARADDGGGGIFVLPHPNAVAKWEVSRWTYAALPLSPLAINIAESALLMHHFSVSKGLLLIVVDLLAVCPALARFVMEALEMSTSVPLKPYRRGDADAGIKSPTTPFKRSIGQHGFL